MDPIDSQISSAAEETPKPDGSRLMTLAEAAAATIAKRSGRPLSDVFRLALSNQIWPKRYLRNSASLNATQQLALAESGVAVVGAGGLGGHVICALARIGIGRLTVIDGDRFDETNLNRQALATTDTLGRRKAHVARDTIQATNPGVQATAHAVRMAPENAEALLADADVAVDALDNIASRHVLVQAARSRSIPLVHGAVAGFDGHVMTVMPDDDGLDMLYGQSADTDTASAEKALGVPAITPAVIAALQAMAAVKLICGIGDIQRHCLHHVNLLTGEANNFHFKPTASKNDCG